MRYKPPPEVAELRELEDLLVVGSKLSPSYHQAKFIRLECGQDFEGHGRASEAWEVYWALYLPHILHHTKLTTGWVVGTSPDCIRFHGRTALEVIQKAIQFLKECPNPKEIERV
jgi:hypothetical protein